MVKYISRCWCVSGSHWVPKFKSGYGFFQGAYIFVFVDCIWELYWENGGILYTAFSHDKRRDVGVFLFMHPLYLGGSIRRFVTSSKLLAPFPFICTETSLQRARNENE